MNKPRQREFVKFLQWLAEEPRPIIQKYIHKQKRKWIDWEQSSSWRHPWLAGDPGFHTGAASADVYALQTAFWYARRLKYIEAEERGDKLIMTLSDRGRTRLIREKLRQAPNLPHPFFLLVMFDIPVQAHAARQIFRRFLRENDFTMVQQSVWCIKKDVREPLLEILDTLDIKEWVQIATADFHTMLPKESIRKLKKEK